MKKMIYALVMLGSVIIVGSAQAQYAAQNDALYMATLRAVVDYKIDDEEIIEDVQELRENRRFLQKLERNLSKLQNSKTKNTDNRKIYKILLQAGKDIDRILN